MNSYVESFEYQKLYDHLRNHGYHEKEDDSSHLAPYIPWIVERMDCRTALDIGCSTGKSLDLFAEKEIDATGVEVSSVAVDKAKQLGRNVIHASATHLPFPDNHFDLVCSADVFEHLHPVDVKQACEEAIRVTRRYIFMKIAEREDATKEWKELAGHSLHLTTHAIDWWKEFFRPHGEFIRSEPELFCFEKSLT